MKCEKQSEKRQATDTQLQRMQLCQWQIIFWPLSLSLYGWRSATVTACFLFSCTLQFCDSWRPTSKMLRCSSVWKTAWLFLLLFLVRSPSAFVVYVSVSVTFSLFLYRSLCSQFFSLSSSLSFILSFSFIICISIRYSPKAGSWTQPAFFVLVDAFRSKVQKPAWGELLCLTNRAMNTHTDAHDWSPHSQLCRLMLLK